MAERKLGIVREIVESIGMEISHVYEDLVFLNHNGFLLRFSDNDNSVYVHRNCEAEEQALEGALAILIDAATRQDMTFVEGVAYTISQAGEEELRIEFLNEK